jgi:hypothetical protein
MVKSCTEKVNQELDITNIVLRLFELEKLKHILLDHDQIKLFDFIPKPTIYCHQIKEH